MEAQNAIYLDKEMGGKGRQFKSRFLVPGLVKYDYGVCLLTKENADKFIQGFIGCPVVINHQDVTDANAKDVSVGNIFSVWFDDKDGYYWCNGIITDKHAIELIDKGYSVSCQYTITEYSDNNSGALHNGNPYDKIIENGKPEHLAIVNNPRYEGAIIAVNAILAQNEDKWITIHPNGEENKGRHLLLKDGESVEDAMHRNGWYNKRQAKEEKNKKTVEEIKQDYIDGKISAKEAEKLLPKDTDTTSWAIAKYNKEHGIKDAFEELTEEDNPEKETQSAKLSDMLAPKQKKEQRPIKLNYIKQTRDGYALYENPKTKTMYMEKDGKFYDMKYREVNKDFETDTAETKEEKGKPKKYTYTLTKKEVGSDAWLGGMADTGNYYTNGSFAIDKRYLNIKGQEPKKIPDIDNNVKKLLTETANKKQKEENYTNVKDFEVGELKSKHGIPMPVAKYSYYDEKNGYTRNIYVNKKYNDLFKNFELKFGSKHSPIYAYDKGELVGTLMPIQGRDSSYTASNSFVEQFKDTLYTCLAEGIANRLGELIASNEDREPDSWITIRGNRIPVFGDKKETAKNL